MRDNNWLLWLLDELWDSHFSDVPQANIVRIEFGRKAKNRLGSIRLDPTDSEVSIVTINGLFKLPVVPEAVVKATIAHELIHYAHGFNSPHKQRFKHPHAGGVMGFEFKERGLEQLYTEQKLWLKDGWRTVVEQNLPSAIRPRPASLRQRVPRPFWFK
jgi:hypothetical protein